MPLERNYFIAAACAIPITLLARWLSVGAIILPLARRKNFARGTTAILTWGGLRGGISVALALSLPTVPDDVARHRNVILAITYGIVVFSIIVQGLTIAPLVRRLVPARDPLAPVPAPEPTTV